MAAACYGKENGPVRRELEWNSPVFSLPLVYAQEPISVFASVSLSQQHLFNHPSDRFLTRMNCWDDVTNYLKKCYLANGVGSLHRLTRFRCVFHTATSLRTEVDGPVAWRHKRRLNGSLRIITFKRDKFRSLRASRGETVAIRRHIEGILTRERVVKLLKTNLSRQINEHFFKFIYSFG